MPPLLDEASARALSGCLDEGALSVSVMREGTPGNERWFLEGLFEEPPALEHIAACLPFPSDSSSWQIEALSDRDWLAHVHETHPPLRIGRFFVRESHRTEAPPQGSILLTIDAVTAFGSGSHGTTAGCLEALCALSEQSIKPQQILDMGTGSGILGIAAWRLWQSPVLAVDIERESIRVACRHRSMNAVPGGRTGMICRQGGRFDIRAISDRAPFDLILANILAAPLKAMTPDLCASLGPGGHAVLSGMLQEQADEILSIYSAFGVNLVLRLDRGEWTTLLLTKPANGGAAKSCTEKQNSTYKAR